MSFVRIHAGDWGEDTLAGVRKNFAGRAQIIIPRGTFGPEDRYWLDEDVQSVEIITEENKKRVLRTAIWGAAGQILLGPVGLLAGLLIGGKGKDVLFACVFKDGKKILATANHKAFRHFNMPLIKEEFESS